MSAIARLTIQRSAEGAGLLSEESDPCAGKLFSSTEKMTAPALYRSNFTPSTSFTLRPAMAIRTSSGSRKYSVPWVVSVSGDSRGVTSPKSTTSGYSARRP